jgi:hypothetical protein
MHLNYLLAFDGVIASRGGIPLIDQGAIIGAIGCSGGTDSQDEVVSEAGAAVINKLPAEDQMIQMMMETESAIWREGIIDRVNSTIDRLTRAASRGLSLLTPSQIDRIRPYGTVRTVRAGEILFEAGDRLPLLCFAFRKARYCHNELSGEHVFATHRPGTVFPETWS